MYGDAMLMSLREVLTEGRKLRYISFFNTMTVKIAKSPKISHLLNLNDSSLARLINASSRKSLEILSALCHKAKSPFEVKFFKKKYFF